MNLPWLRSLESAWRECHAQARIPHAVLLLGAAGRGKRAVAEWLARTHLGAADGINGAEYPVNAFEHADLRRLSPLEDKATIGIDQVRALVAELNLTSYEGQGKVAIIEPANVLTVNAANSLLKTLEEPPGNALLILVADRVGRLPATIFSRCQRLSVPVPSLEQGVQWLNSLHPADYWTELLQDAGNAPLAALESAERRDDLAILGQDFAAVVAGRAPPLEVAGRWSKYEPEFVLSWLTVQVQKCIQLTFGALSGTLGADLSQSVLQRIDRRKLFCYLDTINGLRGQPAGSYNVLLTLESLLIDWAEALEMHQGPAQLAGHQATQHTG